MSVCDVGVRLVNKTRGLSSYAESLSGVAKTRYREKISVINGRDPFGGYLGEPVEAVPPVDSSDLVSYLVLQTNFITTNSLIKAHKSLKAYNQFVCGWIKDVLTWRVAGKYVTTGRVL